MKIAILTSSYPRYPGDATAPFIKSLAENYAKSGNRVFVIAPYDPEVRGGDDLENVQVIRFRYIWPNSLSVMGHAHSLKGDAKLSFLSFLLLPFFLFFGTIALFQTCRKNKIDIIHANWVLPNGPIALIVSRQLKIPFVLSLLGSDIFVAKKNLIFSSVAGRVLRAASSVTACSESMKNAALTLGSKEENTLVLALGADPEKFSPVFGSNSFRQELGIVDGEVLVIAVGRLVYKKGIDVLISAWKPVSTQFPSARLIIVGDGPLGKSLQAQSRNLGIEKSIIFTGRVNWQDLPKYLASADIFVLPSIKDKYGNMDGLPTVLLEAMSSGTVSVASDLGGVSLVIKNWQNGVLVTENSVKELAAALERLMNDPNLCRQLGDAARKSIVDEFNWANVSRKMVELFAEAIRKKGSDHKAKRLGVLYRKKYVELLFRDKPLTDTEFVLDVGCYDGDSINFLDIKNHVAVDLAPVPRFSNVQYVKADGCELPFERGRFNAVFALDVIEHIKNDRLFAEQLKGALSLGGRLILSTPSARIRLYPSFLTKWISRKWGHDLRMGYRLEQLHEYFSDDNFHVDIHSWNAKQFRKWYLVARFLLPIFPQWVTKWVYQMAERDYENREGENGFWIVEAIKVRNDV